MVRCCLEKHGDFLSEEVHIDLETTDVAKLEEPADIITTHAHVPLPHLGKERLLDQKAKALD